MWVGGESKRSCQALKLSLTWALASYWRSRQVIAGHGRRRSMRVRRGGARASGSKRFRASCRIDGTRNGARLRCVRAEECVNDIEGTPGKSEAFPARKRLIGRADSGQCSREPCNKNDLVNNGKSHVWDGVGDHGYDPDRHGCRHVVRASRGRSGVDPAGETASHGSDTVLDSVCLCPLYRRTKLLSRL